MNKHKTTPQSLFSAIKIQLAGIVALAPSFHFHCAEERVSPSTIVLDGKYHSIWLLRKKNLGSFKRLIGKCITFDSKNTLTKAYGFTLILVNYDSYEPNDNYRHECFPHDALTARASRGSDITETAWGLSLALPCASKTSYITAEITITHNYH